MDFYSHNSVAVLKFPAGEGYPRLTRKVLSELTDLLATVRRERLFAGVVIAANDESFATGADIEEIASLSGVAARDFARAGQELFDAIENYPLPVVAAIRGFCLGGGLDLALACHARLATYDSSFGHPGGSLGLITGWGGTQRLPRRIGKAQALQLLLTGERVPATQALTLGLVDELVTSQDLIEVAARRISRGAVSPQRR
ncbi:MAG: enoyl-CoA hydratase/isomerase family protein [Terriglobia bacterium]